MVTFERTRDYELVRRIVTHPKVYRAGILTDAQSKREEWRAPEDEHIWYVLPRDKQGPLAALIFEPQPEPGVAEAHVAFLPRAWGKSVDVCLACIEWLRKVTDWHTLFCRVSEFNRLAVRLVHKIGFRLYASIPYAVTQQGKPFAQLWFRRAL